MAIFSWFCSLFKPKVGLQSGMAKSGEEKKKMRVVVIGGGVGGSIVAYSLQSVADVVLIDQCANDIRKEYYDIPWASLRSMVEPSFAERSVINHIDYLPKVQIIASSATNITDTEVTTEDGQKVAYDYVVIATGHLESAPKTRAERLNEYKADFEKIKSGNTVLIVGGGPTGVELAGEISFVFPDKKLILVHRGPRLLEYIGSKASQMAMNWLTAKKVDVILDQSINLNHLSGGVVQTSSGETIKADCHFVCTGKPIGSSWLNESILQNSLNIHGKLVVDQNLRIRGHKNIFAVGDITDIKEIKQGYVAQKHAHVTAKNLKLLMNGESESKMATYKPGWEMVIVSLGRKDGVAQFPLITIGGYIPGKIKSEDLFVGRTRKQLGLNPYLDEK
nr:apoptosis-inducing factor like a [Quercus suber]